MASINDPLPPRIFDIQETYIGDGVYAKFDGFNLRIYTSDGIRCTHEIFFEPREWNILKAWMADKEVKVKGI